MLFKYETNAIFERMRIKYITFASMALFLILTLGTLNQSIIYQGLKRELTSPSPTASFSGTPYLNYTFDGVFYDQCGNGPAINLYYDAHLMLEGGINGGYLRIPNGADYGSISLSPSQNLMFNSNFTVMFWMKQYNTQTYLQELIKKGYSTNDYNFRISIFPSNMQIDGALSAGFTDTNNYFVEVHGTPLSMSSWHLIAFTISDSKYALIVDGVKIIELDKGFDAITNGAPIEIGYGVANMDFDELTIWTTALSEQEIADYYKLYKPIANFAYSPDLITIGQPVQFFDESSGGYEPYSYFWEFDDGATSVEENPIHTFYNTSKTIFTAKLEIMDSLGNRSVMKKQLLVNLTQQPESITAWTNASNPDDGFFIIYWSTASLAQKYYLIQNGQRIMDFLPPQNQILIQRPPGTYNFQIEAWNICGSTFSNFIPIEVQPQQQPPQNPLPTNFHLWGENIESPEDSDGRFNLAWTSMENVEFYRIFMNNSEIAQTPNITFNFNANMSGEYRFYVEAKFFNGTVYRSNDFFVLVNLIKNSSATNDPKPSSPNNSTDDLSSIILSFLQQNGATIGLGGGAAGIISILVNALKKGKFKLKIPKDLSSSTQQLSTGGDIEDFLDGDF